MRDLKKLIDRMLDVIPEDKGALRVSLKDVAGSYHYTAPEQRGELFRRTQQLLEVDAAPPAVDMDEGWVKQVIAIWNGEPDEPTIDDVLEGINPETIRIPGPPSEKAMPRPEVVALVFDDLAGAAKDIAKRRGASTSEVLAAANAMVAARDAAAEVAVEVCGNPDCDNCRARRDVIEHARAIGTKIGSIVGETVGKRVARRNRDPLGAVLEDLLGAGHAVAVEVQGPKVNTPKGEA